MECQSIPGHHARAHSLLCKPGASPPTTMFLDSGGETGEPKRNPYEHGENMQNDTDSNPISGSIQGHSYWLIHIHIAESHTSCRPC